MPPLDALLVRPQLIEVRPDLLPARHRTRDETRALRIRERVEHADGPPVAEFPRHLRRAEDCGLDRSVHELGVDAALAVAPEVDRRVLGAPAAAGR